MHKQLDNTLGANGSVYLAGPMSGYAEFNYPAFIRAADRLRSLGYEVVSPVELDDETGVKGIIDEAAGEISDEGWARCLARDIQRVVAPAVRAIIVLPGWEDSKGAALEVHVARTLGKPVFSYPDFEVVKEPTRYRPPSDETILEEAARLVGGDRGDDYGHPGDDFARTAGAWKALFGWECSAAQVALAMIIVKLSRLRQTPDKRDSVVDIAGYARTYEMVLEREPAPIKHYPTELPKVKPPRPEIIAEATDEKLRHNYLLRKHLQEREEEEVW